MTGFDWIVVGAGSAGCALANRLSEDGGASVLLLEAGGSDRHPYIQIPLGLGKLQQHRMFDWHYRSEPEPNLNNRQLDVFRGKVLGGSSSVNVMFYTRGHPGDFDRWAREGATGWGWADVLPYFKRSERFEDGETAWRGGAGPLGTSWGLYRDPVVDAWIEACRQCGWPVTADMNGAAPEGVGLPQFTIDRGRRASASNAYLRPVQGRKNLTVLTGAHALGLMLRGTRATGVRYSRGGTTNEAVATKEVILAGGVINSPQLLMLSGIGPAEELRALGVAPVVDLPVGRNLRDHLAVVLAWERPEPGPFNQLLRLDRAGLAMARSILFRDGPAGAIPLGAAAFVRSRPELEAPDIEFILGGARQLDSRPWFPGLLPRPRDVSGIRPVLLHPKSSGSVKLKSTDPFAAPRIAFDFLSHPDDLSVLTDACRRARDIAAQAPLDPFRGEALAPAPGQDLVEWIRATAVTVNHPLGTCRMGTGPEAVVDPELRVQGVEGLRVVDASVFPDMLSAHINAATMMLAERASDLIRGQPTLPPATV